MICLITVSSVFAQGSPDAKSSKEPKPLKWAIKASEAGRQDFEALVDIAKEAGINVEMVVLPDPKAGEADKLLISLMAGDSFDLVISADSNMSAYYNAGVMTPLDSLAEKANFDIKATFGDYPASFDGEIYGLPDSVDMALTLYNKDLFDAYGVSYPNRDNWTWEKYIEKGKQLTDESIAQYGGFNPLWAHYNYMLAIQKGANHYKADGSANYDDPLFKEAVEFYYNLGNKHHVNPEILIQKGKQMPLDYFTSGNVGMCVIGGWASTWLTDTAKYPRDWKAGIVPMPYPEGYPKSSSVVVSNIWVPSTSTQKDLAFKCASIFAQNRYKFSVGRIPALVNLTDEEIESYINDNLLTSFAGDDISIEDIKAVWFDSSTVPFSEKVIGPAAGPINKAFVEEASLYGIGEQNIDVTMKNIQTRANKAILDVLK